MLFLLPPSAKPPMSSGASLAAFHRDQKDSAKFLWRTPLPISTLLVFPWSNLTVIFRFMYKFRSSLQFPQSNYWFYYFPYSFEQFHEFTPVECLLLVHEIRADFLIGIKLSFRYCSQYAYRIPSSCPFMNWFLPIYFPILYSSLQSSGL